MDRSLFVAFALAGLVACGGTTEDPSDGASGAALSERDFLADDVLPYAGDFLDPEKTLAGLDQFDHLPGTVHDDERCAVMMAIAASIVGRADHFEALRTETARRREARADSAQVRADRDVLERVASRLAAGVLRARDVYDYAEVVYRAFLSPGHGADDGQISTLVRAAGYRAVPARTKDPRGLVDALTPGDVFPLTADVDQDGKGWHVMLVWKDASGVVRLADSDRSPRGHLMTQGSPGYEFTFGLPTASWSKRTVFRPE